MPFDFYDPYSYGDAFFGNTRPIPSMMDRQAAAAMWAQGPGGMGTYDMNTGERVNTRGPYPEADPSYSGYLGGGPSRDARVGGGAYGPNLTDKDEIRNALMVTEVLDQTMGRGKYDRGIMKDSYDAGSIPMPGGPLKKGGYSFGLGYGPGNQELRRGSWDRDPHPVEMYKHPYSPERWDDYNFGPDTFRGPEGTADYMKYDRQRRKGLLDEYGDSRRFTGRTASRLGGALDAFRRRQRGRRYGGF